MIVDIHAHALDEAFLDGLVRKPASGWSAEKDGHGGYFVHHAAAGRTSLDKNLHNMPYRLQSLESRGVALQLVGPPPGFVSWPGGAAGVDHARALNAQTAAVAAAGKGRIEGVAALALGEPERARDELQRAMDDYGFRAAIMPSSAGGKPLDEETFHPLWELIERTGILVFMHPTSPEPPTRYFGMHGVQVLVGWPFETSLSIARLIFSGMFERRPGLRLALAHGGGNLVFLRGRLDSAYHAAGWEAHPYYRQHITRPPSEYYKQIYFDTCALSVESVDFVIRVMGAECVMFGSDYPFDIGDPYGKLAMPAITALPEQQQRLILSENASSVLQAVRRQPAKAA